MGCDAQASLLIRADASPVQGTGHVMRCLALGQAWRRAGGRVAFATAEMPPALDARLAENGIQRMVVAAVPGSPADAAWTCQRAAELGADCVVLDGYHFDSTFQASVHGRVRQLLVIDDHAHAGRYHADVLLNQNVTAAPELYTAAEGPRPQLLLGTAYTLVREEFLPWRTWTRSLPHQARRVLVAFGGSDAGNHTGQLLEAAARRADGRTKYTVVVGGGNPRGGLLADAMRFLSVHCRIEHNVRNMAARMAAMDVAIAAAGSITWELAFMGLPSVLVMTADNQRPVARELARRELAICIDAAGSNWTTCALTAAASLQGDLERRRQLSTRGRAMVDGGGARRVVAALAEERRRRYGPAPWRRAS